MADTPRGSDVLTKAATEFVTAKAGQVIGNLGDRASGKTRSDKKAGSSQDKDGDEEENKGFIGTAAQKLGEGASPVKAALSGAGAAVKGLFTRKGGSKRPTNIVEDCFVGVTPDVAFAAWTEFQEFPSYMKGPENVTRGEEVSEEDLEEGQDPHEGEEMNWTAKIFVNRRSWKSNTTDWDPPHRLSWTSEGAKGTIDGTITFTPIGDNATLMLFVLEYRSKGPIEWIGNRWRTVGRRARLDIKHFRRYVMRTEPDELPEPETPEEPEEQEPEEPTDETPDEPEEVTDSTEDVEDPDQSDDEPEPDEPDETGGPENPDEAPAPQPRRRPARRAAEQ